MTGTYPADRRTANDQQTDAAGKIGVAGVAGVVVGAIIWVVPHGTVFWVLIILAVLAGLGIYGAMTEAPSPSPLVRGGSPYGPAHQRTRERIKQQVKAVGGTCAERVCVKPSRRIAPDEFFHLAHDHRAGNARTYLGPAHPECNLREPASRRGARR